MAAERVSTADIESKLRQIRDEVEGTAESARPQLIGVAIAGVALVVALSFLLGRRKGRRTSTVVEIKRV